MSKIFNPADYNPIANPALPRTNSPLHFGGLFIFVALLIAAVWFFIPPKIRITSRSLEPKDRKVMAVGRAINDTGKTVSVLVQFTVGYQFVGAKGDARFLQLGSHQARYSLGPHSSTRISSDFSMPPATMPTQADVQIISLK
jgi:hypothetical protein